MLQDYLISGLVVLGVAAFTGVFNYCQTASSPRLTVRTVGTRVHVEELSIFDGMDKTYGKLYRPADGILGKHPVIFFCHGISVTASDLSYYDYDLQWVCEPGDFEIMVGPNSRDTEGVTLRVQ